MRYDIGDGIRLSCKFTDPITGDLVNPTVVNFTIKNPDKSVDEYAYPSSIFKDSDGVYSVDVVISQSGMHWYRWTGTGAWPSATEGSFQVPKSHFES